jgi:hypothetical protein
MDMVRLLCSLTAAPLARLLRPAGTSGSLVCCFVSCHPRLVEVDGDFVLIVPARSWYGYMMDGMLHTLKGRIFGFQIASYTHLDVCFDNLNF